MRILHVSYKHISGALHQLIFIADDRPEANFFWDVKQWAAVTGGTLAVKEMEYWDDDDLAGELVRATLAYLEASEGRERAGTAARIPDRAAPSADRG